ncbi:MAG: peptide deformylase [Alphaproteobacteria bacterium]|nr:peptide deformylase [Alphaproteobacteria bacterium]
MLQMKLCGDLVLREKCAPVDTIDAEILQNMDEMVKMMSAQNGVGLAAPQVGVLKRFIVMMNPDTNKVFKMINPVILSRSSETVVMEEGCLSVLGGDGLPVYANVTRPAVVTVEWTDEKGKAHTAEMSGLPARIVQHETDHLDGILFVDYLSPVKREMVMSKVRRRK